MGNHLQLLVEGERLVCSTPLSSMAFTPERFSCRGQSDALSPGPCPVSQGGRAGEALLEVGFGEDAYRTGKPSWGERGGLGSLRCFLGRLPFLSLPCWVAQAEFRGSAGTVRIPHSPASSLPFLFSLSLQSLWSS